MRALWTVLLSTATLVGCGAPPPKTGSVELRFSVSDSVRNSAALTDPVVGTVYGDIFLAEDVGIAGPRSGVTASASLPFTDIDLRAVMTSANSVIIDNLAPGQYTLLGFFDVDNNPGTPPRPDAGDPAAFPRTNVFEIRAGEQTKRPIVFDFVYN